MVCSGNRSGAAVVCGCWSCGGEREQLTGRRRCLKEMKRWLAVFGYCGGDRRGRRFVEMGEALLAEEK